MFGWMAERFLAGGLHLVQCVYLHVLICHLKGETLPNVLSEGQAASLQRVVGAWT